MRRLFTGDIAKFALAAIASVSTVGLFIFLAFKDPAAPGPPADAASTPAAPAFELRRESVEPPETPRKEAPEPADAPTLPSPSPQEASPPVIEPGDVAAPSAQERENIAPSERSVPVPKAKRKVNRVNVEPRSTPAKRPSFGGAVRSRASFGMLPNKKCGEHGEGDNEPPAAGPFPEFIGVF